MLSVGCYNSVIFWSTDRVPDWNTLESRRDKHIFKFVKKCITNTVPQFLQNYFTFNWDVILRITRESNCLRIPQLRTEAAKRAFFYIMVL